MNIYVIARQLGGDDPTIPQRMYDQAGPEHIRLLVEPTWDVITWRDAIVTQLFERSVPFHSIEALKLVGHGNAGYLGIGRGLTDELVQYLAPIAAWFRPNPGIPARIVLNGCNIASLYSQTYADGTTEGVLYSGWHTPESSWLPNRPEDRGRPSLSHAITVGNYGEPITVSDAYQLLYQLARTFHASAIAGVNSQPNGTQWNIIGPSLTVRPDGRFMLFGVDLSDAHPLGEN